MFDRVLNTPLIGEKSLVFRKTKHYQIVREMNILETIMANTVIIQLSAAIFGASRTHERHLFKSNVLFPFYTRTCIMYILFLICFIFLSK